MKGWASASRISAASFTSAKNLGRAAARASTLAARRAGATALAVAAQNALNLAANKSAPATRLMPARLARRRPPRGEPRFRGACRTRRPEARVLMSRRCLQYLPHLSLRPCPSAARTAWWQRQETRIYRDLLRIVQKTRGWMLLVLVHSSRKRRTSIPPPELCAHRPVRGAGTSLLIFLVGWPATRPQRERARAREREGSLGVNVYKRGSWAQSGDTPIAFSSSCNKIGKYRGLRGKCVE